MFDYLIFMIKITKKENTKEIVRERESADGRLRPMIYGNADSFGNIPKVAGFRIILSPNSLNNKITH